MAPFKKRSGQVAPPKFKEGDRIFRPANGASLRREGTIMKREDVSYKNGRVHKAYWVRFDNTPHPVHIEQSRLRALDVETQKQT